MSNDSDIFLRVTDDDKLAEECELLLLDQCLSPGLRPDPTGVRGWRTRQPPSVKKGSDP
jgi:hypothetical protein